MKENKARLCREGWSASHLISSSEPDSALSRPSHIKMLVFLFSFLNVPFSVLLKKFQKSGHVMALNMKISFYNNN